MPTVGNDIMLRENGGGVAEDQIGLPVQNPLLRFRKVLDAQEAWAPADRCRIDRCRTADDSSRIELQLYGEPVS